MEDCGGAANLDAPRGGRNFSTSTPSKPIKVETDNDTGITWHVPRAAIALVAAIFGFRAIQRSVSYRKQVLQRLPRKPISAKSDVTFTTPKGDTAKAQAKAMDFSQGRMKLGWPENDIAQAAKVTVSLPSVERPATIVWSNAFYAEIMFDDHLTQAEVAALEKL